MPRTILLISLLLISVTTTGCSGFGSPGATPVAASVAAPITEIEPPPPFGAEGPLQGGVVEIPETWIVPSLQSKQVLAAYLKTTVEQFDWVNPGLEDPVAPGTLVAIPPSYRVSTGESLSAIAAATGLPEDLLRAVNPKLSASGSLPEGTVLAVPPIVVMQETSSIEAAAASLDSSGAALLSANPHLAQSGTIEAGTVLVLPPEEGKP